MVPIFAATTPSVHAWTTATASKASIAIGSLQPSLQRRASEHLPSGSFQPEQGALRLLGEEGPYI